MKRRTLFTIATTIAAACSGYESTPSPAGMMAYDVPTRPAATYHVADSMVTSIQSPQGSLDITSATSMTLGLTFERDPRGLRILGTVSDFETSWTDPRGTRSADYDDLRGDLDLVMGRRGDIEVASLPEISGPAADLSPFNAMIHELFPRLPDRVAEPGDTWVDTVTWSGDGSMEVTTFYTYTLVGDTVVDGRTLQNIGVAGEATRDGELDLGGMTVKQSFTGTTTGSALWDTERGLLVYAQSKRELDGSVTIESMPPVPLTHAGLMRIRLEN